MSLARSTELDHPSGSIIRTPLLVPSFSSKGFGFLKDGTSEITDAMRVSMEFITESILVSAYDVFKRYIPADITPTPEIVFLDSGGYETHDEHDLSAVYRQVYPVDPLWN